MGLRRATAPTDSTAFAEVLTQALQRVARDKHLRVRHHEQPQPERSDSREPTAAEKATLERVARECSFGGERVERLPGNTGCHE